MIPFRLAPALAPAASLVATTLPAAAHESRQMDAHVHGTGAVQIAIDGPTIALEITVPGADIVGFEHAPGSDADRAALDAALAQFGDVSALVTLQGAAACTSATKRVDTHGYGLGDADVHEARAADAGQDDHGHGDHDHAADAVHDDHDDHGHDHGHDDHAAEAAHDDHDHADGATHAEFHAVYEMTCDDPGAITAIAFPYFERFENARELQVQIVSATGAMSATVPRAAPVLSLAGAM